MTRPERETRGLIVAWGLLGAHPYGGMTWQVLHHLEGLQRLGFEVWYVEEQSRLLDPSTMSPVVDPSAAGAYVNRWLSRIGMQERWVLDTGDECLGTLDRKGLHRLYKDCTATLNICGAQRTLPHHDVIDCLIYINTDPGVLQIGITRGHGKTIEELDRHDVHVTYAENLYNEDCGLPVARYEWETTRPPVVCDWWYEAGEPAEPPTMTTVTHWGDQGQDVEWKGESYGWRKDMEFYRLGLLDLPADAPMSLELTTAGASVSEKESLTQHGWRVQEASTVENPDDYKEYVRTSAGEFSVAKEQNVRLRTGWFSDRTACYLAAGRPVVVQDTAFDRVIPVGEGLQTFNDREGARVGIESVASRYADHAQAASEIAREYFDAEPVLSQLLTTAGL